MSESAPDLSTYEGTGEDLTHEQLEYLLTYAQHEPVAASDSNPETLPIALGVEGDGEWA